jgi:hypothetical protein
VVDRVTVLLVVAVETVRMDLAVVEAVVALPPAAAAMVAMA